MVRVGPAFTVSRWRKITAGLGVGGGGGGAVGGEHGVEIKLNGRFHVPSMADLFPFLLCPSIRMTEPRLTTVRTMVPDDSEDNGA